MIFHILGPSGSGKTMIANKLAKLKNIKVIDTDNDINNPNSLRVIEKYHLKTKSNLSAFLKELGTANKASISHVLKDYKKLDPNHNHIILVGFCHVGITEIKKFIDYGYFIDIDPAILWRQYQLRTVARIASNHTEITKLLNSNFSEAKIHCFLSTKFGIDNGFDCTGSVNLTSGIQSAKSYVKQMGYKSISADAIYKDIKKLAV